MALTFIRTTAKLLFAQETGFPRALTDAQVTQRPPIQPLVEGLLFRRTVGIVYGPSDTAKTFFVLHLAFCLATGHAFFGHAIKRRGGTYYVDAEGIEGMRDRTLAWKAHHRDAQGNPYPEDSNLGVEFHPGPVNLLHPDEVDLLITRLRIDPPELLVSDTLSKCMGGAEENASREMNLAIAALERIRNAIGCVVIAIHHTGKTRSRGPRGSSALPAGVDFTIEAAEDKKTDDLVFANRKQKHARRWESPITLTLRVAPFHETEDSCILELASLKVPSLFVQFKKEQRFEVLGLLVEQGKHGATHGELKAAPGIRERNLNRALHFLVTGYALKPAKPQGGRYVVTAKGREAYREVAKERAKRAGKKKAPA